jgi:hypothetical protein
MAPQLTPYANLRLATSNAPYSALLQTSAPTASLPHGCCKRDPCIRNKHVSQASARTCRATSWKGRIPMWRRLKEKIVLLPCPVYKNKKTSTQALRNLTARINSRHPRTLVGTKPVSVPCGLRVTHMTCPNCVDATTKTIHIRQRQPAACTSDNSRPAHRYSCS